MSFIDVISVIAAALETDLVLKSFCQSAWGKGLMVKTCFKKRTEVDTMDLPIILITWPSVEERSTEYTHELRFYCGFYQDDRFHVAAPDLGGIAQGKPVH